MREVFASVSQCLTTPVSLLFLWLLLILAAVTKNERDVVNLALGMIRGVLALHRQRVCSAFFCRFLYKAVLLIVLNLSPSITERNVAPRPQSVSAVNLFLSLCKFVYICGSVTKLFL